MGGLFEAVDIVDFALSNDMSAQQLIDEILKRCKRVLDAVDGYVVVGEPPNYSPAVDATSLLASIDVAQLRRVNALLR